MIKILIADEYIIIRESLKQVLLDSGDMVVVDEAGNSEEMLRKLNQYDCDLLLLDISMAKQCLSDMVKEIKSQKPELPILVMSTFHEEQYARHVMRAGATGFLAKWSAPEKIIEIIRNVVKNENHAMI